MTVKRYRRTAATRERLVQAARELFPQQGYMGTSVDDIVARAESSKGSFYHHYPSKEALFLDLVQHRWQEQQGRLAEQIMQPGVAMSLRDLVARAMELMLETGQQAIWSPVYTEFWIMASRNGEVRAQLGPLLARWRDFLARLTGAMQAAGLVDAALNPGETAGFLINCYYGLLMQSLVDPAAPGPGQMAPYVERALAARPQLSVTA